MSRFANRFTRKRYTFALTHGASATTVTLTAQAINGLLREVIIKTPATVDSSATVTFNITDSDGALVYTKAGVVANTSSANLLDTSSMVPLADSYSLSIVFSAAQTATDTITTVALLVDH